MQKLALIMTKYIRHDCVLSFKLYTTFVQTQNTNAANPYPLIHSVSRKFLFLWMCYPTYIHFTFHPADTLIYHYPILLTITKDFLADKQSIYIR